ncbi:MAG: histidine kinase, partial [Bacteroidales bacterium]|nr:histidine kinase [Bacteroidales bacterium]
NKKNNKFTSYKNNPDNPVSISSNNVWVILFDSNNRLWLGTQGGLNVSVNPYSDLSFIHFTSKHGLSSNVILGLAEDTKSNIWMSTFKGINMLDKNIFTELIENAKVSYDYNYDPFKPLFKTYDASDGLQSNEFNQGAYFKSEGGTIYFGGPKGINYFNPDSIKHSSFVPPMIITNFKIFNNNVEIIPDGFKGKYKKNNVIKINTNYYLPEKITYLDKIILSYRENVFSFEFSSLDYTMPSKNQYAYMMVGFDKDWNYILDKNTATYTNLDPGEYIFRVRGTNSDGKWSKDDANLIITITPPFWKTTWFIILIVISIIIILIVSVSRIIQNQKKKAIIEKERIELQLKTIKNQMDPHFAFNAINMIGSLIYKDDPDAAYDYFTRFARLIRSTLQDSEKISRPLHEELEFVKNFVEIQKTRFKNRFTFELNVDKNIDQNIEIPKMILQTHVENAIKHGLMHKKEAGKLFIGITQENNKMLIIIKDNGIGREKAAEHSKDSTKRGMQIIKQIFALYNKLFDYNIDQQIIDLKDENGNAAGTKIEITIVY